MSGSLWSVTTAAGVFAPSHRALSAGILLTITAIAFEGMAVATVLPSVAMDLGGLDAYGWAFSAFMLASLVGAIFAGQAADRRGARTPARLGFLAFSVGLVVAGMASAWPVLLVARAVQGFGAGSLFAISYVAVARGYPETLRPRLLALLSSAWIVPSLVGPALAGQVAEHFSWRLVFIGLLPAVAIGAWMLLRSLDELSEVENTSDVALAAASTPANHVLSARDTRGRTRGRVLASVRLSVGVALVLVAASQPAILVALLVGLVGLFLAVPALAQLLPRGTFTAGTGLPSAVAVRGLLAFTFFGSESLVPLGLSTQRGVPPSLVGLALTGGALAWVLSAWIQDRAEAASGGDVRHRALRAAGGLLLIALGVVGSAAVIVNTSLPWEFTVVAWSIGGLGMGLAYPATTLTALGGAPAGQEGSAASSLQVAETVGTAAGTGTVGTLVAVSLHLQRDVSEGLTWGFLLTAAAILVALVPALRLAPTLAGPIQSRPGGLFRYRGRAARWRWAAANLLRKGHLTQ